jgi:hypothetical protein
MSYRRPVTIVQSQIEAIDRAYSTAGVKPPARTTEAHAAIQAEPTAQQVAAELAREAFTTTNAKKYLDSALARIARAQAADALRTGLAAVTPAVNREEMPRLISTAVKDLQPAFDALVTDLTTAAAKLDPKAPLSVNNAVRDDTTKELKTAQAVIDVLGVFAGIHTSRAVRNAPAVLSEVLPIVALPECVTEAVVPSLSIPAPTANGLALAGTRVVRDLARALERDTDAALVEVARGKFPGVTFALADQLELRRRSGNASRAFTRRDATPEEARGLHPLVAG